MAALAILIAFPDGACWFANVSFAETQASPPPRVRPTVQVIPSYSPGGTPLPTAPAPVTPQPSQGIPGAPPAAAPQIGPMMPPVGPPLADGMLAWDGEEKDATVTLGGAEASFAFLVSNVSKEPITIISVGTSCGCTVAKLAELPWTIAPGTRGTVDVVMTLAGKQGIVEKSVTVNTDHGHKILKVRTNIQEPPAGTMSQADRVKNLQIAAANRQAVLHGDCAACHSAPAVGKTGAGLFTAACAICHEAEHRAASVPDLKNLKKDTDADYWRTWITSSAEGKLMPAFSIEHGGILSTAQIDSLVSYLVEIRSSEKPTDASEAPEPPSP